jgi:hypothetical protein
MKKIIFALLGIAFTGLMASAQTLASYQAAVNGQSPNYYFTFDGSLTDTTGHGVTLASTPSSWTQFATDIFGNANDSVYFSGSTDTLVDQNESSDLIINTGGSGAATVNSTATGTITFLFKSLDPGLLTAQKYILGDGYTTASHNMMSLFFENTNVSNGDPMCLKLRFGDNYTTILQATNVVPDTWYYFAFTYTEATNGYYFPNPADTQFLYDQNGVITNCDTIKGKWYLGIPGKQLASGITTNAVDAVAGQNLFYLGIRDGSSGHFSTPGSGQIDEFASWNRRLSDAEVQAQFTNLPVVTVPGTLAAYQNVVVTNQSAKYFFPLNGNYTDAVGGALTLQTNTLSSGSYSFAADWFGNAGGSAVFSASGAALTNAANLLSGGGTFTGNPGSGKGSISCLFRTPISTNFTSYATVFSTAGGTVTSNLFMLRFDRVTTGNGALKLYFGDSVLSILQSTNIATSAWYYFAANYDESLATNQVNWWLGLPGGTLNSGNLSATTGSLAGAGSTFVIGNTPTFGSPFRQASGAPGYIADFAIWQNYVLTGNDVTNQFNVLVASSASGPAPTLNIAVSGSNVILSWPSGTDSGYGLQSTPSLASPAWNSAGSPNVVGTEYVVTNALSPQVQFYRLKK